MKSITSPFSLLPFSLFVLLTFLSLSSCHKEGPGECQQVCNNGGTVKQDCTCDCPPGTTGLNCETVLSPIGVRIDSITVVKFPNLKLADIAGVPNPVPASWDAGNAPNVLPDLLVEVRRESNFLGSTQPALTNAQLGVKHTLRFGAPLLAPTVSRYTITLYDHDSASVRESMGAATFWFTDFAGPFPHAKTIRLELSVPNALGPTTLDVHLEWLF